MAQAAYAKAAMAVVILAAATLASAPGSTAEWWNPFKRQSEEAPAQPMTPPTAIGTQPQTGAGPVPLGTQPQVQQPADGALAPQGIGEPVALSPMIDSTSRMDRLEATIRQLNGQIEKLTFDISKLREDLKKLQEDTDYRFQAVENGERPPPQRSDSEPVPGRRDFGAAGPPVPADETAETAASAPAATTATSAAAETAAPAMTAGTLPDDLDPVARAIATANLGAPPAPLGTLTLDGSTPAGGNVVDSSMATATAPAGAEAPAPTNPTGEPPISLSSINQNLPETPAPDPGAAPTGVAPRTTLTAITPGQITGTPTDVYNRAYQNVLDGDYEKAEQGFRAFLVAFPTDKRAPDAQYWIGDSLYQRGLYREAGREFNTGYRAYPKSGKAPDSLLRLGMSLNALGQREAACAVYGELTKRYPNAPYALMQKVKTEQTSGSC